MHLFLYYLLYGFAWLITRLPMRMLYALSDVIYLIIYYLFPYRKKLVHKNLRNSFPEWDNKTIKKTMRKFYRYFCDFFVESAVSMFMKEKDVYKRCIFKNPEILNEIASQGKSVILVFGHYGNWEWSATLPKFVNMEVVPVYKPLNNKYLDNLVIRSRQRYGAKVVPMEKIVRVLAEFKNRDERNISYFISDQRPLMKNIHYWTTFLNQDTPVVTGPEKLAKKLDSAVVFLKINRVKRGFYEFDFTLITADPKNTAEHEITDKFLQLLEKQIIHEPAYWLWTHNRWKHNKDEYYRRYGHREEIKSAT